MPHAADRIRNVALVGHRGSGKTSLHEALLFEAGATNRLGTVADGTTVSDSEEDEQARGMSISAALASFEWRDVKVNLIDTPGEPSFIADALGALRVCESAVFVVNAVMGVEVSTQRLWTRAAELGVARLIYVNMLDRERADFFRALDSLKAAFGPHVVATEIPIGSEHEVRGLIDLVDMKAYEYSRRRARQLQGVPDPRRPGRARAGVPREAHGRGGGELRRADGALPRGRGDLPRRDRARARGGHRQRPHLPRDVRRGHSAPGRGPAARGDRRRSPVADPARRAGAGRHDARGGPGRRDVRLRVQDARRPVRGPHQPLPRLPGHGQRRLAPAQHARPRQGAHGPAARAAGQGGQPHRRVRPRRHRRGGQAQGDARGRLARRPRPADLDALDRAPGAGHGVRDRAQGQGRRGQGVHRPAPAAGGGPDDRPAPRRRDGRADRGGPVADPRRGRGRPPEVALRRRGDAEAAARPLPGDDPRHRQGARPPQEAVRRPRPVRRLPHRDRAARRGRLRVRQQHQGRRHPDQLHPGGREGRGRGDAAGRRGRLPAQGRPRAAVRRQLPHGRLVGDGVQDRGLDRDAGGGLERRARCCSSRSCSSPPRCRTRPSATSWATSPRAAGARWAPRTWAA